MSSKHIVIAGVDTISAIGLRYLLRNYYAVKDVDIVNASVTPDGADLYFISPEAMLMHADFYMIRASRTVVLTACAAKSPFKTLDPAADEEQLLEELEALLDALPETTALPATLSAREIEVVKLVATGHLNKEIADILSISLNTVITHRKNISAKLGIRSSAALSVYALMNGIV